MANLNNVKIDPELALAIEVEKSERNLNANLFVGYNEKTLDWRLKRSSGQCAEGQYCLIYHI